MDDKIHVLQGGGQANANAEAMRQFIRDIDLIIEFNRAMAAVLHARYAAFVAAGFTEAQALFLCKG